MFDTYRRVLSLPGALLFSMTGLVARLPISMISLGIVLLVSERTGSYAYAGGISAVCIIATALASPLQGRIADARGQRLTLLVVPSMFAAGTALLILAIERDLPTPVPHLFAAWAGAALPQIGSLVRARWTYLVDERRRLNTAFAFEAVVDEVVFITGPVLVTLLATLVDPAAGLVVAGATGLVGGLALASQRRTAPPVRSADRTTPRLPMGWAILGPLCVAGAGSGAMFGAGEVVTVAFATEQGQRTASGALLAVWAFASLVSGLVVGAIDIRSEPLRRFRVASLLLTAAMAPLVIVQSVVLVGVTLFVAGFAISPMLVAQMSLLEQVVPRERLTEGLSWFSMGMAAGVAIGGAASGWVVDHHGASPAYLVPTVAAALAAAVAWVVPKRTVDRLRAAPVRRVHLD
ncbi:MFS transporter [Solicola gregarius]|uniref:MFS transporter n=1 Tax=Solicola gregarius TaxID=2908642 RepID=A0AA46YL50_9ACTN|nr:MFS transporter [Solicola gregarius]UYM05264.1 MFS transporter [Solicola gregarius]